MHLPHMLRSPASRSHTDDTSFLLSHTVSDTLNDRDWRELAALYDIHAPLSCVLADPEVTGVVEHAEHDSALVLSPPPGGGHVMPSQPRSGATIDPTVEELCARLLHLTSDATQSPPN